MSSSFVSPVNAEAKTIPANSDDLIKPLCIIASPTASLRIFVFVPSKPWCKIVSKSLKEYLPPHPSQIFGVMLYI
mgnify:CR=1 FL=1